MAKKAAAKREPHLRIRIDPKLTARLERAREANGNTLTGEIVSRLESSFQLEDKLAIFMKNQQERLDDLNRRFAQTTANYEADRGKLLEERKAHLAEAEILKNEMQEEITRLEREIERVKGGDAVMDALIGDDPAAREAIRATALLLANNPGWAASTDSVHKITLNVTAAINTAAAKSATQGGRDG